MFLNSFAKQMNWFVSEQHTIECCSSIIPLLWHLSVNNWLLVYIEKLKLWKIFEPIVWSEVIQGLKFYLQNSEIIVQFF